MPFIYKITNLITGKIYIGKEKKDNPNYLGSGLKIVEVVKKYGRANFKKEIIEHCQTNNVGQREKFWIEFYDSTNPDIGYNISIGGEGGDHYWSTLTEEEKINHNLKISESRKNKPRGPHSDKTKLKMSSSFNRNPDIVEKRAAPKRKTFTCINHDKKQIYYTKNLKEFCEEHSLNYSNMLYNSRTRKNLTESHWSCRINLLMGLAEDIINNINEEIKLAQLAIKQTCGKNSKKGDKNPMFNKTHSEEAKQKIREAMIKRHEKS